MRRFVQLHAQRGRLAARHHRVVVLADDVVVAVELGQLGLDLRLATRVGTHLVEQHLLGRELRMQRRHEGLALGDGDPQLLVDGARRRAVGQAAPAERQLLGLLALGLGLELRQHAPRVHHVGVLVGVAAQQLVEDAALLIDARGHAARSRRGARAEIHRQLRVFADQLATVGVPALLRGVEVDAQLAHLFRQGGDPAEVVLVGDAGDAEIAHLELLQPILGLDQLAFIHADLLVDEGAGLLRVALLVARARVHEQADGRRDQAARQFGVRAAVRNIVEVAVAGRRDLDVVHQPGDDAVPVGQAAVIELERRVGHQLLDVRARDQGPRQHADLLVDVGLERQALHQRLEHGLGIHVHARRGLVLVLEQRDADRRGHADDAHRREDEPTPPPHQVAVPADADDERFQRVVHAHTPTASPRGRTLGLLSISNSLACRYA